MSDDPAPDSTSGARPVPAPVDPLTLLAFFVWSFLSLGIVTLIAYFLLRIIFSDMDDVDLLWWAVGLNGVAGVLNVIRMAVRANRDRIAELERQLADLRLRLPASPPSSSE